MGTNTDPYQRCEGKYHLTQGVVRVLAEAGQPFFHPDQVDADPAGPRPAGRRRPPDRRAGQPVDRDPRRGGVAADRAGDAAAPPAGGGGPPAQRGRACPAGCSSGRSSRGCPTVRSSWRRWSRPAWTPGRCPISAIALHLRPGVREHFLGWQRARAPDLVADFERRYSRAYLPAAEQRALTDSVRTLVARARSVRDQGPATLVGRSGAGPGDEAGMKGRGRWAPPRRTVDQGRSDSRADRPARACRPDTRVACLNEWLRAKRTGMRWLWRHGLASWPCSAPCAGVGGAVIAAASMPAWLAPVLCLGRRPGRRWHLGAWRPCGARPAERSRSDFCWPPSRWRCCWTDWGSSRPWPPDDPARSWSGGLWILGALVTTVLNLDAAVVLLTPLYVRSPDARAAARLRSPFSRCLVACLASSALPVSNLTNLIAASWTGATTIEFVTHLAVPSVVATGVGWWRYQRGPSTPIGPRSWPDRRGLDGPGDVQSWAPTRTTAARRRVRGRARCWSASSPAGRWGWRPGSLRWPPTRHCWRSLRRVPWRAIPWGTALVAGSLGVLAAGGGGPTRRDRAGRRPRHARPGPDHGSQRSGRQRRQQPARPARRPARGRTPRRPDCSGPCWSASTWARWCW